jgi:2-polyprenyl-3-methyl-5-hydroxy-6-metoxy-1,4-benzoquinol methylase
MREMFDRSTLQQAWNRTHQEQPTSDQPQAEVVAFAEHLRRQWPPGARVLDAGCGRGRNTLYLSRAGFARDRVARLELGPRPRVGWMVWAVKSEG